MPRCYECSKVVLPERYLGDDDDLRTWSSGSELIRSADSGCDLCSFIRKDLEKVSTANNRHINGQLPIVLGDFNAEITLHGMGNDSLRINIGYRGMFDHVIPLRRASSLISMANKGFPTHCDLILRACELLKACIFSDNDEHDHCKPCKMDPLTKAISLPRRLLDLSHDDVVLTLTTEAWITENRATVDELSHYCTLSYRWGKGPPSCMLRRQFTEERIISIGSMPRTFQEAIMVARGLGIRFLWIDALCIIQPSAHGDYTDWNLEGPRMWLVYQNSICTIAATCSNEPSDGFLRKVGTDYNPPCGIPKEGLTDKMQDPLLAYSGMSTIYSSAVASTLNRRGWVAQERLLSRRILHFSEDGVFWECQVVDTSDQPRYYEYEPGSCEVGQNVGSHHASLMTLENWLAFIELYSMSGFTLETDRLIALSSIAKCVPIERFGHEYYAGIWGSHLLKCLSWRSKNPCSVTTRETCLTIAPSWSWASVAGGIENTTRDLLGPPKSLAKIINVRTVLAETSNRYGNLAKGALKLHAPLCSISLPTEGPWFRELNEPCFSDLTEGYAKLAWDEFQDPFTEMKVYTVVLMGLYDELWESIFYDALVVDELPSIDEDGGDSCAVYRRIGHLSYWLYYDNADKPKQSDLRLIYDTLFPNATMQTIVIE